MMTAMQETKNMLTQARWPVDSISTGRASVALTRGVDSLAWARAKSSMDDAAMTNPARWQDAGAAGEEDVRMDKVEQLRAAIANGTYSVSAEALAEKMIEHMRVVDAPRVAKARR